MEMQKKTNVYLIDDSAMILWLVSAHISKWLALFQPLGEWNPMKSLQDGLPQ